MVVPSGKGMEEHGKSSCNSARFFRREFGNIRESGISEMAAGLSHVATLSSLSEVTHICTTHWCACKAISSTKGPITASQFMSFNVHP